MFSPIKEKDKKCIFLNKIITLIKQDKKKDGNSQKEEFLQKGKDEKGDRDQKN